jgi:hypothetical protein
MPRKSRKKDDEDKLPRFNWTEPMVHAALDEAIQQDGLKKRAGQGFKAEALLAITAAAQEKADPELTTRLTTSQLESKLDAVRSLSAHLLTHDMFLSSLLFTIILIPR